MLNIKVQRLIDDSTPHYHYHYHPPCTWHRCRLSHPKCGITETRPGHFTVLSSSDANPGCLGYRAELPRRRIIAKSSSIQTVITDCNQILKPRPRGFESSTLRRTRREIHSAFSSSQWISIKITLYRSGLRIWRNYTSEIDATKDVGTRSSGLSWRSWELGIYLRNKIITVISLKRNVNEFTWPIHVRTDRVRALTAHRDSNPRIRFALS